MALPASYTEKTLADYMVTVLGPIATTLGWAAGAADAGSFAESVNEVLIALPEHDLAKYTSVVQIAQVRAFAKRAAWKAAVGALAARFDSSSDGLNANRSQQYQHALHQLGLAEADAMLYDDNYKVKLGRLKTYDPYQPYHTPDELA
jgi:hypothetical protein